MSSCFLHHALSGWKRYLRSRPTHPLSRSEGSVHQGASTARHHHISPPSFWYASGSRYSTASRAFPLNYVQTYGPWDAFGSLSRVSSLFMHQVFHRLYSFPSSWSPEKYFTKPVDSDGWTAMVTAQNHFAGPRSTNHKKHCHVWTRSSPEDGLKAREPPPRRGGSATNSGNARALSLLLLSVRSLQIHTHVP